MKKLLSLILALLTLSSFATMAFAAENVDNTFDNFTPTPITDPDHKDAPANWYDPYFYDENGCLKRDAFVSYYDVAYYCTTHGKLFTKSFSAKTPAGKKYIPYQTTAYEIINNEAVPYAVDYCPYCGITYDRDYGDEFFDNHLWVDGVVYGGYCEKCGEFYADTSPSVLVGTYPCFHCGESSHVQKVYRFISEEQRTAPYAHYFTESAYQFGDGYDGKIEDLHKLRGWTGYDRWKGGPGENGTYTEQNTPTKLTFWQKIVNFFAKIADFFRNLFN